MDNSLIDHPVHAFWAARRSLCCEMVKWALPAKGGGSKEDGMQVPQPIFRAVLCRPLVAPRKLALVVFIPL